MWVKKWFFRQDGQELQERKGGFAADNLVDLVDPV